MIFPEGTRMRRGALGKAKRGVGRLALESGAPVVPIAVHGSEHARRGWIFRPVKVKLRIGRPITFPRVDSPSKSLAGEVTARIWPCVELQYEWLGGLPPLRKAAVVGAGSAGTATAVLLARAGLDVQLGCRDAGRAERIAVAGENAEYLPGVDLPDNLIATTIGDIEFAGVDLVVMAVPSSSLPQVVGSVGARIGDRSAVLALSKGLVQPLGTLPTRYVADRVNARAVAFLGGPSHAAESVRRGAHVVLASDDVPLRDQLGDVLAKAGLDVERTDDVVGVQLAGVAKNAAALAAAAAGTDGMNAAGAAAARVFAEVHALAATRARAPRPSWASPARATWSPPRSPSTRATGAPVSCSASGVPGEQIPRPAAAGGRGHQLGAAAGRGARPPEHPVPGLRGAVRSDRGADRPLGVARQRSPGGLTLPTRGTSLMRRGSRRNRQRRSSIRRSPSSTARTSATSTRTRTTGVGNHHDAEDLTEQTFLQAYRHFERAQRESHGRPLRPWLIRIAHNLAANYYRDRSRKPQTNLEDAGVLAEPHETAELVEGREDLQRVLEGVATTAGRPPRGADHALRARHGQQGDRARDGKDRGRHEGAPAPRHSPARGVPGGGRSDE